MDIDIRALKACSATYTVYNSQDSGSAKRGLNLIDAVNEILTDDGYVWEWRTDADGYHTIWASDASVNSPRGARHMRPTCYAGYDMITVLRAVVDRDSNGRSMLVAMTDEEFSAILADSES